MGKDFVNPWGLTTPKGEVKMMSSLLNSAVFPGIQGGPLEHVIASKAVSFGEALSHEFSEYQKRVKKNALEMAKAFMDKGYKVISGGTDNHLMLIDLRTKFPDLSGKKVENTLVLSHITVNKNMVPFDSRSPFLTSGLRVGTPAVTTRGLREEHMGVIVDMIDEVISNIENQIVIEKVGEKVVKMSERLSSFFCLILQLFILNKSNARITQRCQLRIIFISLFTCIESRDDYVVIIILFNNLNR